MTIDIYVREVTIATVVGMDLAIDLYSKTPSYVQLAEKIKKAIDSGELKPLDQLPSLNQLTEQTGLAFKTVQRAISKLEKAHYVFTVQGRGIFVSTRSGEPAPEDDSR